MSAYTRGKTRDKLTFVKVSKTKELFYGFKTKDLTSLSGISAGDLTALGHKEAGALTVGAITIIGANSPKPPRVKKVINKKPNAAQQGSVSSFCGIDSLGTAATEGWQVVDGGRGVKITNNSRTKTVGAKIEGGGLYLFPMNANDATTFAAELGLVLPDNISDSERAEAFSGTTYPRPAVLGKATVDGNFSSYCSYDKISEALADEYEIIKNSRPNPVSVAAGNTP
jgi:hypothetical protein